MNQKITPVPSTDYSVYLNYRPQEESIQQNPEGYRLMMLFPDNPEDMPEGSFFDQQQFFYSDKDWLFYEHRSGELVKAANVPENQPARWRQEDLVNDYQPLAKLIAHRMNVSQRRLMEMADRGVPDSEAYSREEDALAELTDQNVIVQQVFDGIALMSQTLRPAAISQEASDFLASVQREAENKARPEEPVPV
jgi:hypothetical protein